MNDLFVEENIKRLLAALMKSSGIGFLAKWSLSADISEDLVASTFTILAHSIKCRKV
jgi:hypothetical protein